jgi:hypothetical protein
MTLTLWVVWLCAVAWVVHKQRDDGLWVVALLVFAMGTVFNAF